MEVDKAVKRKRILIWGCVSFVVLILAISLGFLIYDKIYSATLNIIVAPYTASVKVGDSKFSAFGEVRMIPGEYDVEVSADGFETKTGHLVLKEGEIFDFSLYLDSNSEETANWYAENPGDDLIVGEVKNQEAQKRLDDLMEKEPVLEDLPLTVEFYSDDFSKYTKYILSYGIDNSKRGFYLIMKDYTGEGMGAGITKLTEMGMNPVGVEMRYEDLTTDALNYRAE